MSDQAKEHNDLLSRMAHSFDQAHPVVARAQADQAEVQIPINTMAVFGQPKWIDHRPYPNNGDQGGK